MSSEQPAPGSGPPAPGWWQASDGNWYPPQSAAPPPPTAAKKRRGCMPIMLGGLAILVVIIIVVAIAGGDDDGAPAGDGAPAAEPTDTRNLDLYPDRSDRQDQDHEAEVGGSVRLAGYTATVAAAELVTDEVFGEELVVDVEIENRDAGAQPYNLFHWRLQTAGGEVLDPLGIQSDLGSGDLVGGGSTSGRVAFDVGPGTYYVIYKPDPFNAARGIWRVTVA